MSHQSILALLRSGALVQAEKAYRRLGLDKDRSSEDAMALGGRILKAQALEQTGDRRRVLARAAAERYGEAYDATGGTYSGINMAALYLVSGDGEQAAATARRILASLEGVRPAPGLGAYYHGATRAEALLILGDKTGAAACLADAIALAPHSYDAHASTLRQFEMLAAAGGEAADWLDPFRPPVVLHFAGHMWGLEGARAALDRTAVYALERSLDDALETLGPSTAYGALAAGADILIAERLLKAGVRLHVVQPCPDDLFATRSLAPFGDGWVSRFETCTAAATSVRHVSFDETYADDLATAFASETAMGLAALRAEKWATEAVQLLIWDGRAGADAGTGYDAALWTRAGRSQWVVPFPFERTACAPAAEMDTSPCRSLKAMLFADVAGFGALSEAQVPRFIDHVLRPLAACCSDQRELLSQVNTWGDGLFLVFDEIAAAASAALALQATFRKLDLKKAGLPEDMALRVGGHYAPVHTLHDPFLGQPGVFGREVTTAARIEPCTPPGSIYVSEAFACSLAARGERRFRCEPMPEFVSGKDRGILTLFSLRQTGSTLPEA